LSQIPCSASGFVKKLQSWVSAFYKSLLLSLPLKHHIGAYCLPYLLPVLSENGDAASKLTPKRFYFFTEHFMGSNHLAHGLGQVIEAASFATKPCQICFKRINGFIYTLEGACDLIIKATN
jgi:hypothetical protein